MSRSKGRDRRPDIDALTSFNACNLQSSDIESRDKSKPKCPYAIIPTDIRTPPIFRLNSSEYLVTRHPFPVVERTEFYSDQDSFNKPIRVLGMGVVPCRSVTPTPPSTYVWP